MANEALLNALLAGDVVQTETMNNPMRPLSCLLLTWLAMATIGCAAHTSAAVQASSAPQGQAVAPTGVPWPAQPAVPPEVEVHLMGADEAAHAPAGMVVVTTEEMAITDKAFFIKMSGVYPFQGLSHEGWTEAEIEMLHATLRKNGHSLLCCQGAEQSPE